jgi:hypothetical protein
MLKQCFVVDALPRNFHEQVQKNVLRAHFSVA